MCNLRPNHIRLDYDVPHIAIQANVDPHNPRQIKNAHSARVVPLVGAAFVAMNCFPNGFDRYRDKESSASATINKYLRGNGLLEYLGQVFYCFRHTFEDRMNAADFGDDTRRLLFGHAPIREGYGEGGSL